MADVRRALDVVCLVRPWQLTGQAHSGALYVEVTGAVAHVYSMNRLQTVVRATFPVMESRGTGQFTIPETSIGAIRQLPEGVVTFELAFDGARHFLRYGVGNTGDRPETYDPRITTWYSAARRPWVDAEESVGRLPAGVLRAALDRAKPFLLAPAMGRQHGGHFCTAMTFDKSRPKWEKGDGHLFASNRAAMFYFQCAAFDGCHLAVKVTELPCLLGLLRRSSHVTIKRSGTMIGAVNEVGDVLAWISPPTHEAFAYHSPARDQIALWLPTATTVRAVQLASAHLGRAGVRSVVMKYSHAHRQLRFDLRGDRDRVSGLPVPVVRRQLAEAQDFAFLVDADNMLRLVDEITSPEVQLRLCLVPPDGNALARATPSPTTPATSTTTAPRTLSSRCPLPSMWASTSPPCSTPNSSTTPAAASSSTRPGR
jgi:hypothetical protein